MNNLVHVALKGAVSYPGGSSYQWEILPNQRTLSVNLFASQYNASYRDHCMSNYNTEQLMKAFSSFLVRLGSFDSLVCVHLRFCPELGLISRISYTGSIPITFLSDRIFSGL